MVIIKDIGTLRHYPQVRVGEHICHVVISKKTIISHMKDGISVLPGSLPAYPG